MTMSQRLKSWAASFFSDFSMDWWMFAHDGHRRNHSVWEADCGIMRILSVYSDLTELRLWGEAFLHLLHEPPQSPMRCCPRQSPAPLITRATAGSSSRDATWIWKPAFQMILNLCYLSSWVGWTIHTMHFLKELQINHDKGNNAGMLEWHVIVLLLRHNEARRENSSHAALSWKTLILGRLLISLPLNENLIFFFPSPTILVSNC